MSGIANSRRKALAIGTTTAVAAAAGVTLGVLPAFAHSGSTEAAYFAASLNGANEVPVKGGPAVGDKGGAALEFIKVRGDQVSFAVKWRGTDRPTALHIHQGAKGTNGGVKIDLTEKLGGGGEHGKHGKHGKGGKGGWRTATGTVHVKDKAVLDAFKAEPTGFYANLHTAEFPGGAVRGQFHKVTNPFDFAGALDHFQASVVKGKQIYECKKGDDGKLAFLQRDVRAVLGGHIAHSFVAPNSGTPQWIAPDRSAVTGKLIAKTPNGVGNIPELDLQATQSGKKRGLFAHTTEILRLNTVGGVAPAGTCEAGAITAVPYQADYVFIQRRTQR
ncbi:CHRD domain-containing protein [Streptomyces sp. A3M-1-3]|uniref:CHRD domain-containing protein n=1 Tax=Streptomyces sp. A3M-1-3 TaxID=2962044 RepID=UPI0020B89CDF|nr:CHRD domain-containing protein [Streptomyces sp. A3M-1-3]MCP3822363.1 CHRD domain-containing protein [Streptomyces sp. A3M-1-3]